MGAIGWPDGPRRRRSRAAAWSPEVERLVPRALLPPNYSALSGVCRSCELRSARPVGARLKIVTWLILPVVICLSQRLSHACLSISNLYCETANGSLNQLSFI